MSTTKLNKDNGTAPAGKSASTDTSKSQPLAELKNGKVVFKQKPMSLEQNSETLEEIIMFRRMLSKRTEAKEPPLNEIPDEYEPVIAKLAFESDKTATALCKQIQHTLLPPPEEDDSDALQSNSELARMLPLSALESTIKTVASRVNYGLDAPDGCKAPASACVWRWEISQNYRDWLPKNVREKADSRRQDRLQAKKDLQSALSALPADEQAAVLHLKNNSKARATSPHATPTQQAAKEDADAADCDQTGISPSKAEGSSSGKPRGRPKDPVKAAEKEAKEKERQEKRAAKAEKEAAKEREKQEKAAAKAEKERKQIEAQNKSRSLMTSFFSKKPAPRAASLSQPEAGTSQSDFEKTFKPFMVKKDTVLAPVNWYLEPKQLRRRASGTPDDVIVIDEDEESHAAMDVDAEPVPIGDLGNMSPQDHLTDVLKRLPDSVEPSLLPKGRPRPPGPKTLNRVSVRAIMAQITEAEVTDDVATVRRLRAKLADRREIPAKVLIFHTDSRPGYFGTWTRSSDSIGPRAPLAKATAEFDYGYDSGEEWEEEPAGDAEDVDEDEEEGGAEEDEDSDADSWLVDDDEEVEPGTPIDEREMSPFSVSTLKRKADDAKHEKPPKKKKVMPLVPFAKGPCYEQAIGRCEYEPFNAYRIQLFNDTPYPIDPFTYVSTAREDYKRRRAPAPAPAPPVTDGPFLVPPLPDHVKLSADVSALAIDPAAQAKRTTTLAPKNPFPDAHLPHLLATIQQMQAKSVTALIEKIHADLVDHKVRKNAIEAKIREVAEKSPAKVWVLKPGVGAAVPGAGQTAVVV
ncbi:hypothetical protein BD626DRAFT_570490 [Schizophyllum amplum]|uniref:Chromatin assembly factor 1 subunit A-domain-containing protein n=1 Tax=Schizophyllum amplum TaxID=97359 RepID=A0A550CAI0_9AGAR|nr:hypothetical protein BD626DRAFT_570490 [Auriculariopsis ampla]